MNCLLCNTDNSKHDCEHYKTNRIEIPSITTRLKKHQILILLVNGAILEREYHFIGSFYFLHFMDNRYDKFTKGSIYSLLNQFNFESIDDTKPISEKYSWKARLKYNKTENLEKS
jgi:hypothetical protein